MKQAISINVNGVDYPGEVEPRMLLVYYLRDVLGLTGTHVGCETSICGACTILMDGQAVKSCTIFAVQADGSNVTTIEGLAANGFQLYDIDGRGGTVKPCTVSDLASKYVAENEHSHTNLLCLREAS